MSEGEVLLMYIKGSWVFHWEKFLFGVKIRCLLEVGNVVEQRLGNLAKE
jgi:hypothetical protein